MSDESPQDAVDTLPPPGLIHELAERVVDFVRHAIIGKRGGMILDYRAETLPLLDHYLEGVPRDQPATVALIAAAAGAYFGEVARRTLGGAWQQSDDPPETWPLVLAGGVRIVPNELATAAIVKQEVGETAYDVPGSDRESVEAALEGKEVTETEYFSLAGRLEVLELVADVLTANRLVIVPEPEPEPEDA
jgi:hypothetical protein